MIAKRFLLLMLIVFGVTRAGLTQNGSFEPPLIVWGLAETAGSSPQFYRYRDGMWELLYTGEPYSGSVSPAGDYLAYLIPPPFMESLLSEQDWQAGTAWDIVLLDIADGSRRDVAIHTEPIQIDSGSGYRGGIARTVPAWSPDGQSFVWTEQDYPAQSSARLLVYELNSHETRVLDDALPFMNLSSNGLPVVFTWGTGGIVVYTNDPSDNADTLRLYDAEMGLQQVVRLPEMDFSWFPFLGPLWLTDERSDSFGKAVIAPALDQGRMYEVNWDSAEASYITPRLEMKSVVNPKESLRLLWSFYHMFMEPPEALLQLLTVDETAVVSWDDFLGEDTPLSLGNFVISPSGQTAAYVQESVLFLWQDGSIQAAALPSDFHITGLQWGATIWEYATPYGPAEIG